MLPTGGKELTVGKPYSFALSAIESIDVESERCCLFTVKSSQPQQRSRGPTISKYRTLSKYPIKSNRVTVGLLNGMKLLNYEGNPLLLCPEDLARLLPSNFLLCSEDNTSYECTILPKICHHTPGKAANHRKTQTTVRDIKTLSFLSGMLVSAITIVMALYSNRPKQHATSTKRSQHALPQQHLARKGDLTLEDARFTTKAVSEDSREVKQTLLDASRNTIVSSQRSAYFEFQHCCLLTVELSRSQLASGNSVVTARDMLASYLNSIGNTDVCRLHSATFFKHSGDLLLYTSTDLGKILPSHFLTTSGDGTLCCEFSKLQIAKHHKSKLTAKSWETWPVYFLLGLHSFAVFSVLALIMYQVVKGIFFT